MADNSYNIMVSNPVTPFTMARSFKACSNGKIFIGKPDTDPTYPENQIPVYVENESGNTVQVPQPIVINTAGYPVYHGQVAKFVTTQNHSMAVYDSYMVQQFYWENLEHIDPQFYFSKLSSPLGFNLIGTVHGVDKLSTILNPSTGDRVYLDGYYSDWREQSFSAGWAAQLTSPSGGGWLTYDSSLSDVNNGVTIFNGWVRDLSSKKLTSYDAGLRGGDGSDATGRLNALCATMQEGFTLEIYGYHRVNKIVMLTHKPNVKVRGIDGTISAKEAGNSFVFQLNFDSREAILHTVYCDYIEIYNLNIIGCKQINFQKFAPESGDAGIIVWNSKAPKVHHCNVTNVQTWGIAGWGVPGAEIHDNDISYYGTQSGVAVCHTSQTDGITGAAITPIVSNGCKVYRNTTREGGLYGIEFEGDGDVTSGECFENISSTTKWGIAVVNMQCANIYDNHSKMCYAGLFVGGVITNRTDYWVTVRDNESISNACGILIGGASYTKIFRNNLDCLFRPDYVIDNQYCFIRAFGNTNQFYLYSWANEAQYIKAGGTIKIRDTVYTISSVAASSIPDGEKVSWATAGYRTLVTLTADLGSDVQLYDHIKVPVASSKIATRGLWVRDNVSNDNAKADASVELYIEANKVNNFGYGCYAINTYSANTVPVFFLHDNEFKDCLYWLREFRQGYSLRGNTHPASDISAFNSGNQMTSSASAYFKNIIPLRRINTVFPTKTASAAAQNRHFYVDEGQTAFGVEVIFDYPTCTGDIYISINGSTTNRYVITQSNFASISDPTLRRFIIYGPAINMWNTWLTLSISSSTNDLAYTACTVNLLTI